MQFQLPSNLQTQLLAYDPTLKKLVQESKPKSTSKKPKYPLGNINDLIPTEIIRASMHQDATDNINGVGVASRYQLFTRFQDQKSVPIAILYHFEQCWYAAWLPPKGKENEYIYGYAFAFKNTATVEKVLPRHIWNGRENYECRTVGRSQVYYFSRLVTKYDIINGDEGRHWRANGVANYYQKSRDLAEAMVKFEEQLRSTIPSWSDSRGMFDRLRCTCIADVLNLNNLKAYWDIAKVNKQEWLPSADNFFRIVDYYTHTSGYEGHEYRDVVRIRHIIDKPFFRRWIQQRCEESIQHYNNPDNQYQKTIKAAWKQIAHLCYTINAVHTLWPDAPIDYYQTHLDALLSIRLRQSANDVTIEWIREHMGVASYFKMIDKHYYRMLEEATDNRYSHLFDSDLNCYQFSFSDWSDTLSMISRVLEAGVTLQAPKRWRIEEFHDHVQAESWKIKNPNEGLPQDLFPNPVRIELDQQSWSFFQPLDTHQLAMWGQAVRNCVGSASHYAEDCKKKKHFIVLCMLDGKPQFTIQLTVDMGMMSVKQIAGIANQRLTDSQKEQYTAAFRLALQERESALQS
jgi:hypothetical protein